MRILIVHNAYQQRGGEDSVVEAEMQLLLDHGHIVYLYEKSNKDVDEVSRIVLAGQTFWSSRTSEDIARKIAGFKPDVIHVHNTFPLISPSIYWVATKAQIPVIQTLHNFRILCTQAMFLRNGKVCEDCLGGIPWRGVLHGCYRGSKSQSAVLAGMITMHRTIGTWQKKVTRYIALNRFCRQKFIQGGLPAERIVIKSNFIDDFVPLEVPRQGFLFVGRLSAEKGIDVLISAVKQLKNISLRIAGVGPDANLIKNVSMVESLGELTKKEVRLEMSGCLALVLPSICFETFGMVVVEAFSNCTPVIVSNIGALAELVEDGVTGLLFEPGNASDLAVKISWAQNNPDKMREMGLNARAEYESKYTSELNYKLLIDIYEDAIAAIKKS